jgi:hypothetical protein
VIPKTILQFKNRRLFFEKNCVCVVNFLKEGIFENLQKSEKDFLELLKNKIIKIKLKIF